jgi:hypothetical protein
MKLKFELTPEQRVRATAEIAAFEDGDEDNLPERFDGVLVIEDEDTTDGRFIEAGALSWRELPLPLLMPNDNGGHGTDRIAGKIETLERVGNDLRMNGAFDLSGEEGKEAARLVRDSLLRWVSADVEIIDADMVETDDCEEIDGEKFCQWKFILKEGRVMGGTLVPFPAFPGAVVVPEGQKIPADTGDGRPVVMAAVSVKASDFADPEFKAIQNWTSITNEGRVMGHLFEDGECHAGYLGTCLTPEALMEATNLDRSNNIGHVQLADGTKIGTSPLCLKGHSSDGMDLQRASEWMNDPRNAIADVVYGKDAFGVWFSGVLRPTATEDQIYVLRASGVSGEWHWDNGERILMGACVNVPAYKKKNYARIKDGEVVAASLSFQKADPTLNLEEDCGCKDNKELATVIAPLFAEVPPETLDRITALETELAEMRLKELQQAFI